MTSRRKVRIFWIPCLLILTEERKKIGDSDVKGDGDGVCLLSELAMILSSSRQEPKEGEGSSVVISPPAP